MSIICYVCAPAARFFLDYAPVNLTGLICCWVFDFRLGWWRSGWNRVFGVGLSEELPLQ
jgi:hypothetical protein